MKTAGDNATILKQSLGTYRVKTEDLISIWLTGYRWSMVQSDYLS